MGLGTNRLTHSATALVRQAVADGIGMIDAAHSYTGGESERTIGEALSPLPASCIVATKGGYGSGDPAALRAEIEESLRRLRTETIPLYYLHRTHEQPPLETTLGVIEEYMDAGRIAHVGLSQVGIDVIERARRVLPIAAVQNQYNVRDRRWDDVVDHCAQSGIVFVPYFPVRGESSAALMDVARRHQATPAQIKLAWLLHRSPATLPIPGTLSLEHLHQNLAALDIALTDEEFQALD